MTPEQLVKIESIYNIMDAIQPLNPFDHFCVGILAAREAPEFTNLVFDAMVAEAIQQGDPGAEIETLAAVRANIQDLMQVIKPTIGQN